MRSNPAFYRKFSYCFLLGLGNVEAISRSSRDAGIASESELLRFGFTMGNKRGNDQETRIQPKETLNGKIQPGLADEALATNTFR